MVLGERIKRTQLGDLEIVEVDLSHASEKECLELEQSKYDIIREKAPEIVYFLINGKKARFSIKVIEDFKRKILNGGYNNYLMALYGLSSLGTTILKIANYTRNDGIQSFSSKELAEVFLINRSEKT